MMGTQLPETCREVEINILRSSVQLVSFIWKKKTPMEMFLVLPTESWNCYDDDDDDNVIILVRHLTHGFYVCFVQFQFIGHVHTFDAIRACDSSN